MSRSFGASDAVTGFPLTWRRPSKRDLRRRHAVPSDAEQDRRLLPRSSRSHARSLWEATPSARREYVRQRRRTRIPIRSTVPLRSVSRPGGPYAEHHARRTAHRRAHPELRHGGGPAPAQHPVRLSHGVLSSLVTPRTARAAPLPAGPGRPAVDAAMPRRLRPEVPLRRPGGRRRTGDRHGQRRERIAGLAATRPAHARTVLPQTRNSVVVPYGSRRPAIT